MVCLSEKLDIDKPTMPTTQEWRSGKNIYSAEVEKNQQQQKKNIYKTGFTGLTLAASHPHRYSAKNQKPTTLNEQSSPYILLAPPLGKPIHKL